MAIISFGGLATGLDTSSIIEKLVKLERQRSVDFLVDQQDDAEARQTAFQAVNTKLSTLLAAVDKLRDPDSALARKATSSDDTVLTATAGSGAVRGTTEVTVTNLARNSIAASANGKTSATATVAAGSGSFAFKVGSGDTQTVSVDATTTLEDLAASINDLDAGVSASVVNLGTSSSPDYRLRIAGLSTGTSNEITIVTDDTELGVAVTQSAENATMQVSGFATTVTRESNVVGDVVSGVTLTLTKEGGPVTVGVETDLDDVSSDVQAVVTAYNDLVNYIHGQSEVEQDTDSTDRTVSSGPLAFDSTTRTVLNSLATKLTGTVDGLSGDFSLLAELGITSTKEGTLELDKDKLAEALAQDDQGVAALFGGSGAVDGVFDRVYDYIYDVTATGGLIEAKTDGVADELDSLESRIEEAERKVDAFEESLRAQFASLELLVSQIQSQGSTLLAGLGKSSST